MDSVVYIEGKQVLVQDANYWKKKHTFKLGEIVHKTNKEYIMAVKDGFIVLRYFEEEKD